MSSGMSSDQIIKYEIAEKVKTYPNIKPKIFPDSSRDDQKLVEDGGLTFSYDGIDYGSCDAAWFDTSDGKETPIIALEGTDALNRGSSGSAQYQRFHHALGAVRNGLIGIYYLKKGNHKVQLDLYEMAYNVTKNERNGGYYLIIQNLEIVNEILELISDYGRYSDELIEYLNNYVEKMHQKWYDDKFSDYDYSYEEYANHRSTIMFDDYIIKYSGRMKRNFTDSSQRAGHIAVGEMYLSKYLFYGKKVYYLCPRMSKDDVKSLDKSKTVDKEWIILRNEENVTLLTRDDLIGMTDKLKNDFESLSDVPLKKKAHIKYAACVKKMADNIRRGKIKIIF